MTFILIGVGAAQYGILLFLFRRFGTSVLAFSLIGAAVVFWITTAQEPLEQCLSVVFFPIMLVGYVWYALDLALWPALLSVLLLLILAVWTRPKSGLRLGLWVLIFTGLFAEIPFLLQDAWARPRALASAATQGLKEVHLPHFRNAVRLRLGAERAWLNKNNGQGKLGDVLFLWSYREKSWYPYDPDLWRTHTKRESKMMDRIDHKDEPGAYRAAVFEEVQARTGFRGTPPKSADMFIGDWLYRYDIPGVPEDLQKQVYQSFHADGSAPSRAKDGSYDNPKDRWVFNEGNSLSLWSYVEAMPDYGIPEPTYSEDRYHVLVRDTHSFMLFNGDGSLVMIYERVR